MLFVRMKKYLRIKTKIYFFKNKLIEIENILKQ